MSTATLQRTADKDAPGRVRYARQKPDPDTVLIKIHGEPLTLLRMEAQVGPYPLVIAIARVLLWGEPRHGGGVLVRLPPDDVEVILDAMHTIAGRMEEIDEKNSRSQARSLREKIVTIEGKVAQHGWKIVRQPATGYSITREG